jgi:uncharacterized protein (DUF58 family)
VTPAAPPFETYARIADLDLVARIVVEGLLAGLHRSPFHGYSAEFSQYRHYRPGDDLKHVDWKLLARTDRLYTKQFRETTNMAVELVVDASASMAFPEPLSKFRYAIVCAAALARLISDQGDAVGFLAPRALQLYASPKAGRQHLRGLLAAMASLEPNGTWDPAATIRQAAERLNRRGLLIIFSDFYDDEDATFGELRRASRMGHEVVMFQTVSREELDFPYERNMEVRDLETGRLVALNAQVARAQYRDAVAAFLERCRVRAAADGLQHTLVVTDTPPDRALRGYLLRRQASG